MENTPKRKYESIEDIVCGFVVKDGKILYATKKDLYDTCMKSEAGITVIAVAVFSADGEFLGYKKQYVD